MDSHTATYKCPGCGGELVWNPETAMFDCVWCASEYTEGEAANFLPEEPEADDEHRHADRSDSADRSLKPEVYVCSSCGAEIICGANTAASYCCYCHNPVALKGRLEGDWKPDMIIPFQLSRRQAEAIFRAQCMKRHFLPGDFLKDSTLEKMTGLYVPFWLCDCDVDGFVLAEGTEIEHKVVGEYSEIKTRVMKLDRAGKCSFLGVPADGAGRISDRLMDAVEPYDYRFFREFDMSFLSGFFCERYDVDRRNVFPRIKKRVEEGAEEMLLSELRRYDTLNVKNKKVRIYNAHWRYVLLPIWFMTYSHHDRIYSFAMNGQTGKFAGEFPISRLKTTCCGLAAAAAAGIACYFGALG